MPRKPNTPSDNISTIQFVLPIDGHAACPRCGKIFHREHGNFDHCSVECAYEAMADRDRSSLFHTRSFLYLAARSRVNKRYFWDNTEVDTESGCWNWTGSKDSDGYGRFGSVRAHRVAMTTQHGGLTSRQHVLHLCDNPGCVNPDHLIIGDQADNMRQKAARGRSHQMVGEMSPNAKLNWSKVRLIRKEYAAGMKSQASLAREYGVSQGTISSVVRRKTWLKAPRS